MGSISDLLRDGQMFTQAVVGYLLLPDGRVTLGLRKEVSNDLGQGLIAGIGGKLEEGETSEEALIREVDEEIGVKVTDYKDMGAVRFLFPHNPSWQQEVRIYIIEEWQGDPIETDAIKPLIFPVDELPSDRMWADNARWLPRVLGGERIDAVYLYGENGEVIEEQIKSIGYNDEFDLGANM